jgi:hypothetical protein
MKDTHQKWMPVEIELELNELEGLASALRIVRFGDDVCSNMSEADYKHALSTLTDNVLQQIGKLSRTMRGEDVVSLPAPEVGQEVGQEAQSPVPPA